jgi:hypothetical protein
MSVTFEHVFFPGAATTRVNGVAPHGVLGLSHQIVGTYTDGTHNSHGFSMFEGTYTSIDNPAGGDTQLWGINSAGEIVGSYLSPEPQRGRIGFVRSAEGTFSDFAECSLLVDGDFNVYGMNNAGSAVGTQPVDAGASESNGFAYIVTPGGGGCFTYRAPDTRAELLGINDANHYVGYQESGNGSEFEYQGLAFFQPGQNPAVLNAPGATRTVFTGINDAGVICGHNFGSAFVRYNNGSYTIFDYPEAYATQAYGISNSRYNEEIEVGASVTVVGAYFPYSNSGPHGFVAYVSEPSPPLSWREFAFDRHAFQALGL